MGSMHDKVSKLKAAALSKNGRTYVVGAAILVFFVMLLTLSSGGSSGQQVNAIPSRFLFSAGVIPILCVGYASLFARPDLAARLA